MAPSMYNAEIDYLAAREIAENFLKQSLLTEEEFSRIDTYLLERFQPPVSKLFSENKAKSACNFGETE